MNAAQVIGPANAKWANFICSLVGRFYLLVFCALGLGERNGEQSERRLAVAAQLRTRVVGRAGVPGARNAGTAGSALACPVGDDSAEPSNGGVMAAASVPASSGAHDAGVKRSSPSVGTGRNVSGGGCKMRAGSSGAKRAEWLQLEVDQFKDTRHATRRDRGAVSL